MGTRRAFSLVEILVVLVILLILFAVLAPHYLKGGKSKDGKTIESPIQRGHSVECINNLSQLRQGYKLATTEDDAPRPQTLKEVGKGFPESMFRCPVGGQPYQYDPATGRIWCVQPGHESY
jgi:prepilin-type N-terminal cleavage/methylation domain-containing protein